MSSEHTNKEMLIMMSVTLETLTESNTKIAKDQFQLAADFSAYMNKTDLRFAEVLGYLESNGKTNQKGIIEQQGINTKDITLLKSKNKFSDYKWTIWGFAGGGGVSGLLYKLFF